MLRIAAARMTRPKATVSVGRAPDNGQSNQPEPVPRAHHQVRGGGARWRPEFVHSNLNRWTVNSALPYEVAAHRHTTRPARHREMPS
jgi:hypothetical protein